MRIVLFLLFFGFFKALGQVPDAQFSVQSSACLGENIPMQNQSSSALRYEWDICQGDLSMNPTASLVTALTGNVTVGIDMIFDGINWFAFVTNQNASDIIRLDFGTNIDSTPTVTHLGNISGLMKRPADIKVIYDGGNWYGFVYGLVDPFISRIDFGASLTNTSATPSAISATTLISGAGSTNGGLDMIRDGSTWFIVLTDNNQLRVIRLPVANAIPIASDISAGINNSFSSGMGDIFLQKSGASYYGYVVAFGNKTLQRLSFGTNLFSAPIIEDLSSVLPSGPTPYGLDGGWDNGQLWIFVSTIEGNLLRLNMGSDLSQLPVSGTALGTLSTLENTLRIRLVKHKTTWKAFALSWSSRNIYRISFPSPNCEIPLVLAEVEPVIKFNQAGTKNITLRAFGLGGTADDSYNKIIVTGVPAPQVTIAYNGICTTSVTNFEIATSATLTAAQWDFGDGQSSVDQNPSHQYSGEDTYKVALRVTGTNSCTNFETADVLVYSKPDPDFSTPPGIPVCTNNEYTMTNSTLDVNDNISYQWFVDAQLVSSENNLKYTFITTGNKEVKLIASNPGCSNEKLKQINNVQSGPTVGFDYEGQCEDESVQFINNSIGDISNYLWDLGNGQTSTSRDVSEIYSIPAQYPVSLQTTGSNGCVSFTSKVVKIYSVPQTNFSIELPPFSCAGTPSQFNDLTPPMPDSNVATWTWSFGDAANGSSSNKNPLYTYSLAGDYPVSLLATTNFGCSNSIQKTVTIKPSPVANFSLGPACVNQGTQFSDLSTGDIKSWLWSVQNRTYAVKNAQHIFNSPATYNIMLTVAANNNCIGQITKTVIVPVPVAPDFTVQAMCATKPALFNAVNLGSSDAAVSWSWDFAGQAAGTGASVQHIFPLVGNYSVAMSTTRQSGCTYSVIKTIPVIAPPKALFSLFLNDGAAPFAVEFVNTSSQATTYLWKFGDASNVTSNSFSPSFTYTTLGNYMAELVAGNAIGCTDTFSQPINVVVPAMNAAITNFDLKKIPTGWSPVVTIENKSNIALINPDVYLDISGGALISEKINGVIKPGAKLTHIFITNISPRAMDYACAEIKISADTFLFDNRQCVNVTEQFISVAPYPNPANEELIFEWIGHSNEPLRVVIYNSSGQVALNREYSSSKAGLNQVKVDVTNLKAGIYFTIYSVDGLTQNFRFSVAR